MQYAKVKGDTLLLFPYTADTLAAENPHTSYDSRFSLVEWFSQTDAALVSGETLVEVTEAERPEIDLYKEHLQANAQPDYIDGQWVLGWSKVVTPLTPEALAKQAKA